MRATVYLRLSQDRNGDGLGVERQREDCVRLIEQRGWTLAREPFVDNDRSAARGKVRPEFLAMLQAIRRGEVDAVVAWALDRLARNARDRLALIEACQDAKVMIALVRGNDIDCTTANGRLVAGVLGEFAQHEIDQKSDRQRRASRQAAEHGRWIGGRKPFGFHADGVTVLEHEAAAIRDGYAALLAGVPLRGIADEWNARGLTTGQAPWKHEHRGERSPWRPDSVRRVLTNPRYCGIRAYRGEEYSPASWPAIVSEETFRAAGRLLRDPSRRAGGAGMPGRQFLTGIALCGADGCEATVHGGGASHRRPVYRCSAGATRAVDGPPVPGPHVNRLAGPVDEWIGWLVIERLSRSDARELLVDHHRPDVPALRDEATALRGRLDSLAMEFADGELTASQLRVATERLRVKIDEIEAQIADAGRVDLLGPLVTADDCGAAWEALSLARRRAVVDELMVIRLRSVGRGSRTFRPETVDISWRTTGSTL